MMDTLHRKRLQSDDLRIICLLEHKVYLEVYCVESPSIGFYMCVEGLSKALSFICIPLAKWKSLEARNSRRTFKRQNTNPTRRSNGCIINKKIKIYRRLHWLLPNRPHFNVPDCEIFIDSQLNVIPERCARFGTFTFAVFAVQPQTPIIVLTAHSL